MLQTQQNKFFYALLLLTTLVLAVVALVTDGTAGNGDSLCHYLMARASWKNPVMFFDLWGKPVFTLLSSPFAQIDMKAVKVFNVLCMAVSAAFLYHTALKLNLKYAWLVVIFLFFSSETIEVTLSSFTEPVFALVLSASIYLLVHERIIAGAIVCSFLPFARQEGLIIMPVIAVYLVYIRAYKALPFLLTGHLVLGILGYPYYHNLLWPITQNPYAGKVDTTGDRHWNYFLIRMYYLVGPVSCALMVIGLLGLITAFFSGIKSSLRNRIFIQTSLLVAGIFLCILTAHSIFWATGMFASIGLTRVMVTVWPAMALLCVTGTNVLISLFTRIPVPKIAVAPLLVIVAGEFYFTLVYPPTAIDYKLDFYRNEGQQIQAYRIAPYVLKKFPGYHMYISDVGLSFVLDQNYYDSTAEWVSAVHPHFNIGGKDLIIWDKYFTGGYEQIPDTMLLNNPHLKLDTTFTSTIFGNVEYTFKLFVRREE